jgi:transcriptional regulator with XRE-family HTH domain
VKITWKPEQIQLLRSVLGMTADQMSSELGITASYLSEIESGDRRATMYLLDKIRSLYNANLHRFELTLVESFQSDRTGFLECIQESFPLSGGDSLIAPSSDATSCHLDLLLPAIDEGLIHEKIHTCAAANEIEVSNIARP